MPETDCEQGPARGNTPRVPVVITAVVCAICPRAPLGPTLVCSTLGLPKPGPPCRVPVGKALLYQAASAAARKLRGLVPPCANVAQLSRFARGSVGMLLGGPN